MEYIYPATFEIDENGMYLIKFPDLPGCVTQGTSLTNALHMAEDVLSLWLDHNLTEGNDIPAPSKYPLDVIPEGGFANLVRVRIKSQKAVTKTISIPQWMDLKLKQSNISLSEIVQEALRDRL